MKLTFHGAVRGVTGSCYLLEVSSGRLLIDCGLFQGKREVAAKQNPVFDFEPSNVDAVLVTHAHLDHVGRLPLLAKRGFRGPIFSTPPTKELALLVVEDAARLQQEKFEKFGDEILYTPEEAGAIASAWQGRGYETRFEVLPGVEATFHQAGHILGSSFISLTVSGKESSDGQEKTLVFSGDIGNDDVPILPNTSDIGKADLVVVESTYGNRDHEPSKTRKTSLVSAVSQVVNRGGTLIIPAFSIERTQELLYLLDELVDDEMIPRVPIFLDSPLAIRSTAVYRKYESYLEFDRDIRKSPDHDFFTFPGLIETLSVDASKDINRHKDAKIIVSGSGMMNGGRVRHHLLRYLDQEKNGVMIIGFQAPGTLGRRIQDGQERVTIERESVDVKAKIFSLDSFSAHGDRNKLTRWLQTAEGLDQVVLTHGDPDTKDIFKVFLEKKGLKQEVVVPDYRQTLDW